MARLCLVPPQMVPRKRHATTAQKLKVHGDKLKETDSQKEEKESCAKGHREMRYAFCGLL